MVGVFVAFKRVVYGRMIYMSLPFLHKYYEECDWSKKWAEGLQKIFNLKGLHRLDINDYLSTFFFIWCN